jgi:hypothetical protein
MIYRSVTLLLDKLCLLSISTFTLTNQQNKKVFKNAPSESVYGLKRETYHEGCVHGSIHNRKLFPETDTV